MSAASKLSSADAAVPHADGARHARRRSTRAAPRPAPRARTARIDDLAQRPNQRLDGLASRHPRSRASEVKPWTLRSVSQTASPTRSASAGGISARSSLVIAMSTVRWFRNSCKNPLHTGERSDARPCRDRPRDRKGDCVSSSKRSCSCDTVGGDRYKKRAVTAGAGTWPPVRDMKLPVNRIPARARRGWPSSSSSSWAAAAATTSATTASRASTAIRTARARATCRSPAATARSRAATRRPVPAARPASALPHPVPHEGVRPRVRGSRLRGAEGADERLPRRRGLPRRGHVRRAVVRAARVRQVVLEQRRLPRRLRVPQGRHPGQHGARDEPARDDVLLRAARAPRPSEPAARPQRPRTARARGCLHPLSVSCRRGRRSRARPGRPSTAP